MRSAKLIGGAVALLVVAVAVGGYLYFFSGLRSTPKPLALATPSATATGSPSTSGSLAGAWTVASGSTAGYRATEQFVGQASNHEAVARTSDISGGLTITGSGTTLRATNVKLTVQLANLKSQDTVAGRDVASRDQVVQRALDTSSHPTATLTADSIALPAGAASGTQVSVPVQAQLSIHGVTKTVSLTVQGQAGGGRLQVAGAIPVDMTDYGVQVPRFPFVTVQPGIQLEFQARFTKQGA